MWDEAIDSARVMVEAIARHELERHVDGLHILAVIANVQESFVVEVHHVWELKLELSTVFRVWLGQLEDLVQTLRVVCKNVQDCLSRGQDVLGHSLKLWYVNILSSS